MEYMYAAMLLHSAKKPITEEAVTAILSAAGVQADGVRVKALVAALAEVNIDEALKAPVFAAAAAPAAAPAAEVKEEKKAAEKPKVEEKKEEDLQGLGALFG
ncbi:50S ribosomal protein P1 [Candidatus Bathyarchaeota archaeon RBG_13_52_12]|jgi:large subunit ribosomal protein L12|nr:MAG: 50S ribosomal protein P1 [Candidatus Bathyarchaeota archaeon RBG_13_52_12]